MWESVIYYKNTQSLIKDFVLFLCGRWARHCYITSLLTLHWSINNRPIQVANNRPIYVVGCTWSSNTCKVSVFLIRWTEWSLKNYVVFHNTTYPATCIIFLALCLESLKLVDSIFIEQSRVEVLRPGDLINVIGTKILRSVPEIMDREFEKKWSKKNVFIFSIKKIV